MALTAIKHKPSLCGKPDVPLNGATQEDLKKHPARCLCCNAEMYTMECDSESMQELGMFLVVCPLCPLRPQKAAA